MSRHFHPVILFAFAFLVSGVGGCLSAALHPAIPAFIDQHCAGCHDDVEKEADLDLWSLSGEPITDENLGIWIHAFDRLKAGEMPPEKKPQPGDAEKEFFQTILSEAIIEIEQTLLAEQGRSVKRRLNRYEYENALRDLLSLPYLEAKESLPEDPTAYGFNKSGEALDVSHVQMSRYLKTAESALREAISPQVEKPIPGKFRFYTWQEKGFRKGAGPAIRKTYPVIGHELRNDLLTVRDPETKGWVRPDIENYSKEERKEKEAMVMLMSTYEPAEIRWNNFRAPVSGYYNLTFSGYTIWMSLDFKTVTKGRRTEPITIYSEIPPRQLRRHGAFDFGPEPSRHSMTVWLKAGESIQPDATRLVRSRPPDFENPYQEEDGMPGVAFQWMEVEGPFFQEWPQKGHKTLFGNLAIQDPPGSADSAKISYEEEKSSQDPENVFSRIAVPQGNKVTVISQNPKKDAEKLLRNFMAHAYRRPVRENETIRFLSFIHGTLDKGFDFVDAMIAGYTAVLSSPGFLYLEPNKGELDGYALAERLAFFLWNSPPDGELRDLAENGKIKHPDILSRQVERLLNDPRSRRFVNAFLDYWLDLRNMGANGPDAELYPEYQLDDALTESLPEETQLYFSELINRNLSVRHVVDSDFVIINERLATLYDLPGIRGADFRPVALGQDSPRGGLMTQGSVLKVTANGTTSSPVVRGAWMMERIFGYHIPPPPASVEAIESDIRGAKTIREQLALHRSQESCNSCHVKIDPAGFALENFDVMGGWRDQYRTTNKGLGELVPGVGHDGMENRYRLGLPVDASGQLPDGRKFRDILELKELLLSEEEQLARNLCEKFTIYATGAPIRFSDRKHIEAILERSRSNNHGIRTLIHELAKSDLFLYK